MSDKHNYDLSEGRVGCPVCGDSNIYCEQHRVFMGELLGLDGEDNGPTWWGDGTEAGASSINEEWHEISRVLEEWADELNDQDYDRMRSILPEILRQDFQDVIEHRRSFGHDYTDALFSQAPTYVGYINYEGGMGGGSWRIFYAADSDAFRTFCSMNIDEHAGKLNEVLAYLNGRLNYKNQSNNPQIPPDCDEPSDEEWARRKYGRR